MKAGRSGEDRRPLLLSNDSVDAAIELEGGMMPVFALRRPSGRINVHWLPPFRLPAARAKDGGLLGHIAGDFLCCPNFGPECGVDGEILPPHGWTANDEWRLESFRADSAEARCDLSLDARSPGMPLSWRRRITVLEGQNAYYSLTAVRNRGEAALHVNIGHHNTVGPPFLEAGCRISLAADRFMTAPEGTEFDATGRLEMGAEFEALGSAPLRGGGVADLREVPGLIGSTDFVTGAVPGKSALGWSCVVNPRLKLAYLCLFPGEAALPSGEIALSFNDLWMQYGGRRFEPWAPAPGAPDRTFCLGTENATGAFASGLSYSLGLPRLLGRPTTVRVEGGAEARLCYAAALVEIGQELLAEGVRDAEAEEGGLVLKGGKAFQRFRLEADFGSLRSALGWPGP